MIFTPDADDVPLAADDTTATVRTDVPAGDVAELVVTPTFIAGDEEPVMLAVLAISCIGTGTEDDTEVDEDGALCN